ncbi:ribonuclease P protein component [Babesia caballi]|uniref:Ribonuclease P protein component n=1 Tax=Babesia caballi TaxID=5871 RepID=A0AAV4LRM0_BABCB|nr:ribonuclease P protein component [Babesia caballi]
MPEVLVVFNPPGLRWNVAGAELLGDGDGDLPRGCTASAVVVDVASVHERRWRLLEVTVHAVPREGETAASDDVVVGRVEQRQGRAKVQEQQAALLPHSR